VGKGKRPGGSEAQLTRETHRPGGSGELAGGLAS
jgi:hypothetical protein